MPETSNGQTYRFKLDGKEWAVWDESRLDTDGCEFVRSSLEGNGMDVTNAIKISGDGNTLSILSKGNKPNGEAMDTSATSQRVSGGPGLAGNWKSSEVNPASEMWDIKPNGEDGLVMGIVDYQVAQIR